MRRRQFLGTLAGAAAGAMVTRHPVRGALPGAAPFLIPMDSAQPQPLKAYGVVYRALQSGGAGDWLLNHRGGAFLLDHAPALHECLARGVMTEAPRAAELDSGLANGVVSVVRLEVAPRIAVYVPPYAAPWDDAVRLALEFAEIPYATVWDRELLGEGLPEIDWLHLHHEDFTGQYGKYGASIRATDWYREAVRLDGEIAAALGYADAAALKAAVARVIEGYVARGGFLFAMCASSETLDLALAGDPPDYDRTLAFTGFELERGASGPFSTIDGHRVNAPDRLPLDSVQLAPFAPAVDPVAAMLAQNHRLRFPDWYGLTTSFRSGVLKPHIVVLATCAEGRLAKYIHGDHGQGTFTFLGGHDPEDAEHAVGDPPTDLAYFPRSPGYRLILNNVLFPAARQEERKT